MNMSIKLLAVPALALSVVAGSVWYANDTIKKDIRQLRGAFDQQVVDNRRVFSQVKFLIEQYQLFKHYAGSFEDLTKAGFVGRIDRLSWIDDILLFSSVYGFDNFKATLKPVTNLAGINQRKFGARKGLFKRNPVEWSGVMRDDMDWLRMRRFIHDRITRFSYFDNCDFKKVQSGFGSKGSRTYPGVSFSCMMSIVTAKPALRKE